MLGQDLDEVVADRQQFRYRFLPAVAQPLQVRGHVGGGQAGDASDVLLARPRRHSTAGGTGGEPGHLGEFRLIGNQATDDLVDRQPLDVGRGFRRWLREGRNLRTFRG